MDAQRDEMVNMIKDTMKDSLAALLGDYLPRDGGGNVGAQPGAGIGSQAKRKKKRRDPASEIDPAVSGHEQYNLFKVCLGAVFSVATLVLTSDLGSHTRSHEKAVAYREDEGPSTGPNVV